MPFFNNKNYFELEWVKDANEKLPFLDRSAYNFFEIENDRSISRIMHFEFKMFFHNIKHFL